MNKQKLFNILLIVLPAVAVSMALSGNSVTIFDKVANTTVYQSYFDLLPAGTVTMATVLAGVLVVIADVLAAAYVFLHKQWCVKGVFVTAVASAFAAEIPVLMQGDVLVVPNVMVPIAMLVVTLMAYARIKKPDQKQEKKQRLNRK